MGVGKYISPSLACATTDIVTRTSHKVNLTDASYVKVIADLQILQLEEPMRETGLEPLFYILGILQSEL